MDSFQIIFDTYHDRQNGFIFGTNPAGASTTRRFATKVRRRRRRRRPGIRQRRGAAAGIRAAASTRTGTPTGTSRRSITEHRLDGRVQDSAAHAPVRRAAAALGRELHAQHPPQARAGVLVAGLARLQHLAPVVGRRPAGARSSRRRATSRWRRTSSARRIALHAPASRRPTSTSDWGVDAKYGVTPSLNLDLTYNTDFAQVEADQQQINLTRFNLVFPEKRPFFLENAGLVRGRQDRRGRPVLQPADRDLRQRRARADHRRRAPQRQDRGVNVGVLNMQTEDVVGTEHVRANNWTALRVNRELPNRSRVGVIFTNRAATSGAPRRRQLGTHVRRRRQVGHPRRT